MRTPSWESSAGALAALLNSATQVRMVDLYTITLLGGAVLRYTSADVPVSVNAVAYATGPVITRGATKVSVGIAVDTLKLTLAADATVTVNGVALLRFIAGGGLDNARLALDRAFAADATSPWVGTLGLFQGRVSDTDVSRYEASVVVNSDTELLNVMVPRNVYQPGCGNTLFDGSCGLLKASYQAFNAATTPTNAARTTFTTTLAQAADYWALGWAVGTSGANNGVGRTIKAYAAGVITTIQPWPAAVVAGDNFVFFPGCDKRQSTCSAKFANLARFRGQPYVPAPETVI